MLSFLKNNREKQMERGSIMLEVIAVLALMGVMGAMLFRQIYQRNQELHNIQMASEIRTVKEAFSAYIQANRSNLILNAGCTFDASAEKCTISETDLGGECTPAGCTGIHAFLPDGWFPKQNLSESFHLTLWGYKQDEDTQKAILYGVIIPKQDMLPKTGWNFKRAARVALLIGADGGVYGDVSGDDVVGALGTWSILEEDLCGAGKCPLPTYAAITGIDIFTPEYELPEGQVNLPEEWNLATGKLHAWNQFSAGSLKTSSCYEIRHNNTVAGGTDVDSDDIKSPASCNPLFWVERSEDGSTHRVFVNNDLEVGKDGTAAIKITQEGRIVSAKKVAADLGDLKSNERFVVDPAYTSTMNDIRLTSRGGVRLSDILPDYSLTKIYPGTCTAEPTGKCKVNWTYDGTTTTSTAPKMPSCPKGYKRAALVVPISTGKLTATKSTHSHKLPETDTGNNTNDGSYLRKEDITLGTGGSVEEIKAGKELTHTHKLPETQTWNANASALGLDGTKYVEDINIDGCTFLVQIDDDDTGTTNGVGGVAPNYTNSGDTQTISVTMGWSSNPSSFADCPGASGSVYSAILQTYCLWKPSLLNESECKAAGYKWDGSACKPIHSVVEDTTVADNDASVQYAEPNKQNCRNAGFEWDDTNHRCKYIPTSW